MSRYQKFVENKKKEGKKRRYLWCTDEEWAVIKYLFSKLELPYASLCDINPGDLCLLIDSKFDKEKLPSNLVVKIIRKFVYRYRLEAIKLVVFKYKGKAYIQERCKLKKIDIKG